MNETEGSSGAEAPKASEERPDSSRYPESEVSLYELRAARAEQALAEISDIEASLRARMTGRNRRGEPFDRELDENVTAFARVKKALETQIVPQTRENADKMRQAHDADLYRINQTSDGTSSSPAPNEDSSQ